MAATNNPALEIELRRAASDKSINPATAAALDKKPVNNVAAAVWNKGDEILVDTIVPENLKIQVFGSGADASEAPFCVVGVKDAKGKTIAKRLYFSSLTRNISKYSQGEGEVIAEGTAVNAGEYKDGEKVYTDMMSCATVGDQFAKLQSYKTLKVVDVVEVETARYQNGVQLPRTRKAKLAIFSATE